MLTASRIRTFRCDACDQVVGTNAPTCKRCGRTYEAGEIERAADREDRLLKMEHDASHAHHSVIVSYLWYGLGVVLVAWHAKEDITGLDLNLWAYLHELQFFLVTGVVVVPIFLGYAGWLLARWRVEFSGLMDPDVRVVVATAQYRAAWRHLAIAIGCYLVLIVTPLAVQGVNVFGL